MITLTATKLGTMFYYIVSTFTDGAHRIASSLPKKILYLVLVLLAPTFQLLSVSTPLLLSLLPYFIFIDIALALMLVFLFSDWKRISTLYSFSTINFYNSAGACPWLVCRSSSGGVITYTFQCKGISLDDWRERQKDLESAFDCHILCINYADGSDNLFEIKFIPAKGKLPTNTPAVMKPLPRWTQRAMSPLLLTVQPLLQWMSTAWPQNVKSRSAPRPPAQQATAIMALLPLPAVRHKILVPRLLPALNMVQFRLVMRTMGRGGTSTKPIPPIGLYSTISMPCARLVAFLLCLPVVVLTALLIVDVTTS